MPMSQTDYLLTCLSEECAEIQYSVSKALRFGLSDKKPGQKKTNKQMIQGEFNDLVAVMGMLVDAGIVDGGAWCDAKAKKKQARVRKYMKYSQKVGRLA